MASTSSSIQVVVRLRPINEKEKKFSTLPVVKASTANKTVTVIKGQGSRQARNNFAFDNVFGSFSTQQEVFEGTLKPCIQDVMQGYESTVFAYGQTGTGKTHTMEGSLSDPEMYGIIPRSAEAIFEAVSRPEYENVNVTCSYLEIYNEELGDLLAEEHGNVEEVSVTSFASPNKKKRLEILEGHDGPFCRGLRSVRVDSAKDVLDLMMKAQQYRKVGETKMNRHSSRSHCLFTIKVHCKKILKDGGHIDFCGKLNLVDLAGSECAKSAGNSDTPSGEQVARERERLNINRSLLTLGRVIKILKDESEKAGKKGGVRIPYRDSKLTRILQESLGGRCKTLIVATLSPSVTCIEESLSTLHYAQSANGIINKPISNSKMSVNSNLFSDTASTSSDPNAVDTWNEMECRLEYMQNQVEEAQAALARKHMQQQELADRAEKAEELLLDKEKELHESNQEKIALREEAEILKVENVRIAKLQREAEIALMQTRAILEATQHTEECLTKEAKTLLQSLEESKTDGDKLYLKISEARDDVIKKRSMTKKFHSATVELLANVILKLENMTAAEKKHLSEVSTLASAGHERESLALANTISLMEQLKGDVQKMTKTIQDHVDGDDGMKVVMKKMGMHVEEKANEVKLTVQQGEDVLSKGFDDAHTLLQDYSIQIKSMNTEFAQSAEKIASSIEARILESKEKVSAFVSSASKSLTEVKNANAKSCKDFDSTFQSIFDETSLQSSNIIKQANGGANELKTSVDTFESRCNFGEMDNVLEDQSKLAEDDGKAHLREISTLKKMIESQRESFKIAATVQSKKQDEALSKIFSGVQKMLNEEIEQLRKVNEKHFLQFNTANNEMMQTNGSINSSGKNILSELKKETRILQEKVSDARANDELIGTSAKEACLTFKQLSNSMSEHKTGIETFVNQGRSHLTSLVKQNKQLDAASNQMDIDGQVASTFIAQDVTKEAKSGIRKLIDDTTNLSRFASETVLKSVENDISAMKSPRAELMVRTSAGIDNITNAVLASSEQMSNIMAAQTSKAREMSILIESKHDNFINETSSTLREEMVNHKRKFISTAEDHSSSKCRMTLDGIEKVGCVQDDVKNFSENTMECNENVDPLDDRVEVEYSSNLSSTPVDSIIIQKLGLSSIEEGDNEIERDPSVIERDECASLGTRTDVSHNTNDISTQASMPLPRHPMSNVSNSKENRTEKTAAMSERLPRSQSRSRSRSRSTSKPRLIKKRAHSRPKAVKLRKRVPSMATPTKSSDF